MIQALTDKWWVLLLRGLFGLFIGLIAFATPGLALLSIVMVWGLLAEADGIGAILVAFSSRHEPRSHAPLFLVGTLGIVAGLIAWGWPAVGLTVLVWILAAWAIGRGVFQLLVAFQIRRVVDGEWLMILSGALSLVFGLSVLYQPLVGLLTLAYLFGVYACSVGILEVALAFRVRQLRRAPRVAHGW